MTTFERHEKLSSQVREAVTRIRCHGEGWAGIDDCRACDGTGSCQECRPNRKPAPDRTLAECQAPPLKTPLGALAGWRTS